MISMLMIANITAVPLTANSTQIPVAIGNSPVQNGTAQNLPWMVYVAIAVAVTAAIIVVFVSRRNNRSTK